MRKNLRQLEDLQDKIRAIPDDEWSAAATIVIEQKRNETGIVNWLPSFHNGRRKFEERTIALVEERRKVSDANQSRSNQWLGSMTGLAH